MLAMLGTCVGALGRGMSVRDIGSGSLGPHALFSWSNVLQYDQITRIVYVVHEAIVGAASLSVTAEVLQEYGTTNTNAREVCTSFLKLIRSGPADLNAVARAQGPHVLCLGCCSSHLATRHIHRLRHHSSLRQH